jgi:hypothetical protein
MLPVWFFAAFLEIRGVDRAPAFLGLKNWGDRYPLVRGVKGSTTLVDQGEFLTLIVTWNYSIEPSLKREQVRGQCERFWEIGITQENRGRLLAWRLTRSILRP